MCNETKRSNGEYQKAASQWSVSRYLLRSTLCKDKNVGRLSNFGCLPDAFLGFFVWTWGPNCGWKFARGGLFLISLYLSYNWVMNCICCYGHARWFHYKKQCFTCSLSQLKYTNKYYACWCQTNMDSHKLIEHYRFSYLQEKWQWALLRNWSPMRISHQNR